MLLFLLLVLLFRSVCHQVSKQADKLDILAIFIFSYKVMVSFAFFVFVRHTAHCFLLLVSCMLYMVKVPKIK